MPEAIQFHSKMAEWFNDIVFISAQEEDSWGTWTV